jgi:hypothetical protein
LFIIIILPRISSGAIDIKSLQDLKKIFVYWIAKIIHLGIL